MTPLTKRATKTAGGVQAMDDTSLLCLGFKDQAALKRLMLDKKGSTQYNGTQPWIRGEVPEEKNEYQRKELDAQLQDNLQGPGDAVLVYLPCDGGSPWQQSNWSNGGTKANQKRLWQNAEFRRQLRTLDRIFKAAHRVGATIAMVCPQDTDYWRLSSVRKLLARYDLVTGRVHSAALGIMSVAPTTVGQPLALAWKVATNSRQLLNDIPDHGLQQYPKTIPCVGKDNCNSQCPIPMVSLVLRSITKDKRRMKRILGDSARPPILKVDQS